MELKEIFYSINMLYEKMEDDESKNIFLAKSFYNISGDDKFIRNNNRYMGHVWRRLLQQNGVEFSFMKDNDIVVFGAGKWGKRVQYIYPEINIVGYMDNNITGSIDGIPIFTMDDMKHKLSNVSIIVSPLIDYDEIYKQLIQNNVEKENIFLLGKKIVEVNAKLARKIYFDLPELKHRQNEIFVDVGGYYGETTQAFYQWSNGQYKDIYVYEPNEELYAKCRENLKRLPNVNIVHAGAGDTNGIEKLYLDTNKMITRLNNFGRNIKEKSINIVKLDEELNNKKITFIKMDIEGSEIAALKGAERIICNNRPKLAISVYHKQDDIWKIPKLLLQYIPEYKLYLRHYSVGWYDTVLYAV